MSTDVIVVDLEYLAPVPVGNRVLVLNLARSDGGMFDRDAAACVIDQTTCIVFGDDAYSSVLLESKADALPAEAPAGALGPSWSVAKSLAGQVVGCVLGTADSGKSNYARTRLYLRTTDAHGYR